MGAVQALQVSIEAMQEDLKLCKKAVANGGTSNAGVGRVDYPRRSRFDGARDAKEVENFLWQMEQYFDNLGLGDESAKIKAATSYLTDTAMLWWRRRHADIERGTCRMDTWEAFKKELKRQFYPENVVYEARRKLRELRQKGMIRDYVKEFTTLVLQIPNLSDQDLVFHFIDGLQGWAKQELQRRGVNSVDEAIVVAESLSDYSSQTPHDAFRKKIASRGGGERKETQQPTYNRNHGKSPVQEEYEAKKRSFIPRSGCYVCKGPHPARDFLKLGLLSALIEQEEADAREDTSMLGSLQLLNALKTTPASKGASKGLMYVDVNINGQATQAMVDTGATHIFVSEGEARRLGLTWTKGGQLAQVRECQSPTPSWCCTRCRAECWSMERYGELFRDTYG
ncbi:hypothetical protein V5N11_015624 [Cardamine amara subsp. amara]|uniref:Retrotransposon gag domain-containing protein n=1 Tax=Cardamine amara subsp. amara TaxID=228776 RepID=A0ABD1C5U3_CARAN